MKEKQTKKRDREPFFERHLGPLLITPSTLVIFGILFVPIFYALYMSVNKISFRGAGTIYQFAGLKNFIALFTTDPWFVSSFFTTILFVMLTVATEIIIGVAASLVLNKKFHGRGFVRGLMILPWAMPTVVNAVMWKWIFNSEYGAANGLLMKLGIVKSGIAWLGTPKMAFFCVFLANVWKETPYVILLAIAALSTIPEDLYEAASIDGAGGWKAFWRITLPMIKPVLLILLITKTIWAFQTFDLVAIMTSGGPQNATNLLSYYIHFVAFKKTDFGSAAAMSYVLSMICFALSFIYIKLFMNNDEQGEKKAKRLQKRKLAVAGHED